MSYTPTSWNTGDTITASALNKIENGIANAGGAMIVTSSQVNGVHTMDKTVQEIYDALMSGTPVYYKYQYGTVAVDYVSHAWLAPISYIYTYGGTDYMRVVVNCPIVQPASASGSSGEYLLAPAAMIFQASTMNDHPTYYRTTRPSGATTYSYPDFTG